MSLNSLNEIAQNRFDALRSRLKLDGIARVEIFKENLREEVKKIAPSLSDEDFDKLQMPLESRADFIRDNQVEFVDNAFDFIENLKLSPRLSLAIGLIISGHKSGNKEELHRAIEAINGEINDK